jgi:long-chain acyl-CoA synthetase
MYTSGSTGTPKGVMHSFERVTRASEGIVAYQEAETGRRLYLPCAVVPAAGPHLRAGLGGMRRLCAGARAYFLCRIAGHLPADLQRARPTVFISVPRLWLKFQQGVFANMPQKKLDRLLSIPILGKIVAKKVLTKLGLNEVIQAGSGSAPIPPALISWYRRLGLHLVEGYGMTEDFAFSHTTTTSSRTRATWALPSPACSGASEEDGEVLIKSPGTLVGYYKRPDLDAESFTEDGFFRTGDLGEVRPRRPAQADRPQEGAVQDRQGQIRGARAD